MTRKLTVIVLQQKYCDKKLSSLVDNNNTSLAAIMVKHQYNSICGLAGDLITRTRAARSRKRPLSSA